MKNLIFLVLIIIIVSCSKENEEACECFAIPVEQVVNKSIQYKDCVPLPNSEDPCEVDNLEAGYVLWANAPLTNFKWLKVTEPFIGEGFTLQPCPTAGLEDIQGAIRWNPTFAGLFANDWSYDQKFITINGRQYQVHCEVIQ